MNPTESHAWFRAASVRQRTTAYNDGARAACDWRVRLFEDQERADLRTLAPRIAPNLAASAAARVAVELAIIVDVFPDRIGDVLRASWE